MNCKYYLLLFALLQAAAAMAQKNGFRDFIQVYPVGEDADINFRTSYVKYEKNVLFEANPIVRYSFSNNILQGLGDGKPHVRAYYVSFTPQVRMYTENSLPVKTPSYRILLGTQQVFRLGDNLFTISLESGHYSNGQAGSAFSEQYNDGSPQSDSIYRLITPNTNLSAILNRKSGNFSTNLTELVFNYRINKLDDVTPNRIHSLKLGALFYHDRFLQLFNFGGFSDADIKIYGRVRLLGGYEYSMVSPKGVRHCFFENAEWIFGAHNWVNPFRSETGYRIYPFHNMRTLGFVAKFIHGHDNYNFRFVDSGTQGSIGFTWSNFPPFPIKNLE
ncbi:hypothetical protein [Chitinophaga sp. GbtcB8]|uniref:hypothetical protein n=1 Tax=Chitinophaga sp. GbtcB8 TaxID=2824753 RepID=UPI001C305777|nr:hypothetical protein [Chitinophaga sp. GbtcB8]